MVRKVNKVKVIGGSTLTSEQQKTATPEQLRAATLTPEEIAKRTAQLKQDNPVDKTQLQNKAESQGVPVAAFKSANESNAEFQNKAQNSPVQKVLTSTDILAKQRLANQIAFTQQIQQDAFNNIPNTLQENNFLGKPVPDSLIAASGFLTHSDKASAILNDISRAPVNEIRGIFLAGIGKIPGIKNINPLANAEDYVALTKIGANQAITDYESGKTSFLDAQNALYKYAEANAQLRDWVHLANQSYTVRKAGKGQALEEEVVNTQKEINSLLQGLTNTAVQRVNAGVQFQ